MKKLIMVLIALNMAACATVGKSVWINRTIAQSQSYQRFAADKSYCLSQAYQSVPLNLVKANSFNFYQPSPAQMREQLFTDCMNGKNWNLEVQDN